VLKIKICSGHILPFLLFGCGKPICSFVDIKQRLVTLQLLKNVERTLLFAAKIGMIWLKLHTTYQSITFFTATWNVD